MVYNEIIKNLCHIEVYNRIPIDAVEDLKILHQRIFDRIDKGYYAPLSRGGYTEVVLAIKGKKYIGTAVCSPSDNFCKRTGRRLAFRRAARKYRDSLKKEVV